MNQDTESGSFDESLDLDNIDLNKQRLSNGHRAQLGCGLDTQPAVSGQNELRDTTKLCSCQKGAISIFDAPLVEITYFLEEDCKLLYHIKLIWFPHGTLPTSLSLHSCQGMDTSCHFVSTLHICNRQGCKWSPKKKKKGNPRQHNEI